MTLVAYSICRRCATVFPDGRACPRCDGDAVAASAIAQATAHAAEPVRRPGPRRRSLGWGGAVVAACAMTLVVGVGLGWWFASRQPAAPPADAVAADR